MLFVRRGRAYVQDVDLDLGRRRLLRGRNRAEGIADQQAKDGSEHTGILASGRDGRLQSSALDIEESREVVSPDA